MSARALWYIGDFLLPTGWFYLLMVSFRKQRHWQQCDGLSDENETGDLTEPSRGLIWDINKILHLEYCFVWCWNLDTSGSRSEIPGKFWNVVLEKDGEISWTDHVKNEEVLLRVNEQRNILHEIRKRKANWIGHILRRNCILKQVIEGKIKGEMEVEKTRKKT